MTNVAIKASLMIALAAVTVLGAVWILAGGTPSTPAAAQEKVTVEIGDIWYCSADQMGVCETTIEVGDTITWDFTPAELPHTVTECGASCDEPTESPLWDSGLIGPNSEEQTFEVQFDEPGTFLYYCQIHPFTQLGRVVVGGGGATPTPTPDELPGDANCDEEVTSIDSLLVLQFVAGLIDALSCADNADVNGDGTPNALDAQLILQRVAGLIPAL